MAAAAAPRSRPCGAAGGGVAVPRTCVWAGARGWRGGGRGPGRLLGAARGSASWRPGSGRAEPAQRLPEGPASLRVGQLPARFTRSSRPPSCQPQPGVGCRRPGGVKPQPPTRPPRLGRREDPRVTQGSWGGQRPATQSRLEPRSGRAAPDQMATLLLHSLTWRDKVSTDVDLLSQVSGSPKGSTCDTKVPHSDSADDLPASPGCEEGWVRGGGADKVDFGHFY